MRTTQQPPGNGHDKAEPARLITTGELAQRLGVTSDTIRKWTRDRRIPCLRVGRKTLRFDLAAVLVALEHGETRDGGVA